MQNPIQWSSFLLLFFFFSTCTSSSNPTEIQTEEVASSSKKTIILAIDGGGIKGILPAYFINQLEKKVKRPSHQMFDIIGGTSTGGIIAVGLTAPVVNGKPHSASDILGYYRTDCSTIFYPNHQDFCGGSSYFANQDGKGVEPFLQSKFGDTLSLKTAKEKMTQLDSNRVKQVFTTSYLVNSTGGKVTPQMGVSYGPYLFNWADASDAKHNYYIWEAARATSAAPTYFPIALVGGTDTGRSSADMKWAIDGGVMSNNPAMWALTEGIRTGVIDDLNNVMIISVGCGLNFANGGVGVTNEKKTNKGIDCEGQLYGFWDEATWMGSDLYNLDEVELGKGKLFGGIGRLVDIALDANQFVPATQLEALSKISGFEYHRVQINLPQSLTKMDDCDNTEPLYDYAKNYFDGAGASQLEAIVTAIKGAL